MLREGGKGDVTKEKWLCRVRAVSFLLGTTRFFSTQITPRRAR